IATHASTRIAGGSGTARTARSSTSTSTACCWTFRAGSAGSVDARAEVGAEGVADDGVVEREIDDRGEPSDRRARVVAVGAAEHPVEWAVCSLHTQRIGQLDLAAGAWLHPFELREDIGRQHVPADDDEIAGGVLDRRFLDERAHTDDAVSVELALRLDHDVRPDAFTRHS